MVNRSERGEPIMHLVCTWSEGGAKKKRSGSVATNGGVLSFVSTRDVSDGRRVVTMWLVVAE
jgi:hypothetical protein